MKILNGSESSVEPLSESFDGDHLMQAVKALQQARLETRESVTLAHIFKGRNADYLRSTQHAPYQLVQACLNMHLMIADEERFADFSLQFATTTVNADKSAITAPEFTALLASGYAPLHIEVLCATDRAENRLLKEFYLSLCDNDADTDWERFSQFVAECDLREECA